MKVELISPPAVITEQSIKQYLADCSSVVRNAQPKDNDRLFNRLLKESFGDKPSRVFEYVPCKLSRDEFTLISQHSNQFFGFFGSDADGDFYYTNARELLFINADWDSIIEHTDFTNYRAVKITTPYFIYGQVSTHNQITTVSHSNRYTEAGMGYWIPDEVINFWINRGNQFGLEYSPELIQSKWNKIVETYSPKQLEKYMKLKGVNRREVFARGVDMLQLRVATLGGYLNNPNAWPHFINQRLHDPHTQKETRELTAIISKIFEGGE